MPKGTASNFITCQMAFHHNKPKKNDGRKGENVNYDRIL